MCATGVLQYCTYLGMFLREPDVDQRQFLEVSVATQRFQQLHKESQ